MAIPTAPEVNYQAEEDARILTEAQVIKADKKRLKEALAVLKQHKAHKENAIADAGAPKTKPAKWQNNVTDENEG
jgi:hypothetical protein